MGLADVQRVLARLYTDEAAREQFWAGREAAGVAWGLSPEDIAQLARVSREEIDSFAASLLAKRRNEVAKLLPLTVRALGPRFRVLFRDFSREASTPSGPGKHREDAIRFGFWLAPWIRAHDLDAWRIAEIAAYEAARLKAAAGGKPIIVWFLRISPADFLRLLNRPGGQAEVRRRPAVVIWFRPSSSGPMRQLLITSPWPSKPPRPIDSVAGLI